MRHKSEKHNHDYIIKEATKLAEKIGRDNIKFELIANELEITRTILYKLFSSTEELKEAVLAYAILNEVIVLIIEAIIFKKIKISSLSKGIRFKIINYIGSL